MPAMGSYVEFFQVTGDGSFATYHTSDMSSCEGYTNAGAGGAARLGYAKQGHGWLAWDAQDSTGTRNTSVGDVSGQTLSQFLAANPTAKATLYLNLDKAEGALVGSWAITTIRCGNEGVMQEDAGAGTGQTYASPAPGIAGSTQAWAWRAGTPPYPTNGIVYAANNPDATFAGEPWIAAGNTDSHYSGGGFTAGQEIVWGGNTKIGYDGTMATNGGEAWALAALIGMDWGKNDTNVANAEAAGQIVNKDANGNAAFLSAASYVGTTNPRNGVVGNWYAVELSQELLLSLANDPQTKGLIFNNWFAGTTNASGNPSFVTKDQAVNGVLGAGAAFLALTPEPATMVLLALGGLVALRRRA